MNDTQDIESHITDRPIFKASAETEKLIQALKKLEIDATLTWMQMHEITGCKHRTKLRGCLATARKHLLNEDQACFAAVMGIGLKRLRSEGVIEQESTTASKVRRTVHLSMRRLSTVNPEGLEPQLASKHRMTSAALGAISLCVKPSSISKLKQATLSNGQIDGKGALALFGN
jgi:hypothetical protein